MMTGEISPNAPRSTGTYGAMYLYHAHLKSQRELLLEGQLFRELSSFTRSRDRSSVSRVPVENVREGFLARILFRKRTRNAGVDLTKG